MMGPGDPCKGKKLKEVADIGWETNVFSCKISFLCSLKLDETPTVSGRIIRIIVLATVMQNYDLKSDLFYPFETLFQGRREQNCWPKT